MKVLRIRNIDGLFHEMFDPIPNLNQNIEIRNGYLDATSSFWAKHLERSSLQQLIQILKLNIQREKYQLPQYLSVVSDENSFIQHVLKVPELLSAPELSPQNFFAQLEVMGILCNLYSDFIYSPFKLTVQDAFVLDESSSKSIYDHCLNPCENPWFSFVSENVLPLVYQYNADIIFLQGKISYYFMTIALLAKQRNPNVHICVTRHASEYYSLNKISDLLVENDILFQMVDSIILEYFDEIEPKIISALSGMDGLRNVPNLIYRSANKEIIQTQFAPPEQENVMDIFRREISSLPKTRKAAADIHFEPYTKCHWNRCVFCGINQKYRHSSIATSYEAFFAKIKTIQKLSQEYEYIWFIDEALAPDKLRTISEHLISENIHITWQARCRADIDLIEDGLPELLAKAGLRELRIGLESASYFILAQMKKFDERFSLELMENIIKTYYAHNISIHCPMILGFPQENASERQKTYEFLSRMCRDVPLFTFNLNILNLDISSKLYRNWEKFQLESIAFTCPPKYFLGNCVAWIPAGEQRSLDHECQAFMREHLYPWMPVNAITPPTILYRLSETSRYTLRWKADGLWEKSHQNRLFSAEMELQISKELAITHINNEIYLVYSWDSHHYMQGNQFMLDILKCFDSPCKVSTAINTLVSRNPDVYRAEELIVLLQKFYMFQYLKGSYQFHNIETNEALKAAYDHIYQEESFIYTVEVDRCLQDWSQALIPGLALELGVGFGKNIDFLRERGFQVTGVDFSEVAIEKMRKKHPDCEFFTADIRDFPIAREKYSLIICSLVLSYLNKEDLAILAHRIMGGLTPGGILYLTDLSYRDPLALVPVGQTSDHRNFLAIDEVTSLFSTLDIIELSDVFRKEPKRIGCRGAFGLINFLGQKPEILEKGGLNHDE